MTASEARSITDQKPVTTEKIIEMIKDNAQSGMSFIRLFDVELTNEVIKELLNLGYTLQGSKGMIGEKIITITW